MQNPSEPVRGGGASIWRQGMLSPLCLAAYVTWAAVGVQAVDWPALLAADPTQLAGAALLVAFLAAFVVSVRLERATWACAHVLPGLAVLQGVLAIAATWWLRNGTLGILLIIVTAQLFSILPRRAALAWLILLNLGMFAMWASALPLAKAIVYIVPLFGFQAFAALTAYYSIAAERARDRLAEVNAQLLATQELLEQSARSEERLRLSRELHDVAGHKLTALKLNLARLARDPGTAQREEVRIAAELADELLADIRAVVGELRKHEGIDLRAALQALARQLPGTRVRVEMPDDLRVDAIHSAETLLRCAQEAITNAVRHGRPGQIVIRCERVGASLLLEVVDDGASRPKLVYGNGLTGMRERLEALGGSLEVRPVETRGVRLSARIPAVQA